MAATRHMAVENMNCAINVKYTPNFIDIVLLKQKVKYINKYY